MSASRLFACFVLGEESDCSHVINVNLKVCWLASPKVWGHADNKPIVCVYPSCEIVAVVEDPCAEWSWKRRSPVHNLFVLVSDPDGNVFG